MLEHFLLDPFKCFVVGIIWLTIWGKTESGQSRHSIHTAVYMV